MRWIMLAVSIAGMIGWLTWMRRNPRYRGYGVGALTWLMHAAIFSAFRLAEVPASPTFVNAWSLMLHLHGLYLATGAAVILAVRRA